MPYRKKNYATAHYHYEEILRQTNIYLKESIHDFNVIVIFFFYFNWSINEIRCIRTFKILMRIIKLEIKLFGKENWIIKLATYWCGKILFFVLLLEMWRIYYLKVHFSGRLMIAFHVRRANKVAHKRKFLSLVCRIHSFTRCKL